MIVAGRVGWTQNLLAVAGMFPGFSFMSVCRQLNLELAQPSVASPILPSVVPDHDGELASPSSVTVHCELVVYCHTQSWLRICDTLPVGSCTAP